MVVFLLQGYLTSGRAVRAPAACCEHRRGSTPAHAPRSMHARLACTISMPLIVQCSQPVRACHLARMQALIRTLWLSGGYAAFETFVAAVYIFGAHVPLFLYGCAAQTWPPN